MFALNIFFLLNSANVALLFSDSYANMGNRNTAGHMITLLDQFIFVRLMNRLLPNTDNLFTVSDFQTHF